NKQGRVASAIFGHLGPDRIAIAPAAQCVPAGAKSTWGKEQQLQDNFSLPISREPRRPSGRSTWSHDPASPASVCTAACRRRECPPAPVSGCSVLPSARSSSHLGPPCRHRESAHGSGCPSQGS